MKTTLLLIGICLNTVLFSQTTESPKNYDDSLKLAKSMIDQLSQEDLLKQRERFMYLNNKQPSKINKAVFLYIEEKLNNRKPRIKK